MHPPRARLVAGLCALVSLALSGYLAAQPHFLLGIHSFNGTGYDDGVYFGAADRLVHGVVPYRDFTFVQPPGAIVIFTPLGLLGRWIGTADALAVGRVLTLAVAAVNSWLAAWVLRSRGRAAMAIAGLGLACFPLAATATHSLNLEPYLVLFILLAVAVGFTDGRLATSGRLFAAGALLGVATEIKVWGLAAAVALIACGIPQWRRMWNAAAGFLTTALVLMAPFFVAAPTAFIHQVVFAQLNRKAPNPTLSVGQRLGLMIGLDDQSSPARHATAAVSITVGFVVLTATVFWRRRRVVSRLEWFVLIGSAGMTGGLLVASQFYDHYAYATAVFLALLLGLVVSRGLDALTLPTRAGWAIATAAVVLVGAFVIPDDVSRAAGVMAQAAAVEPAIAARIPAGSCIATNDPILLIEADRWNDRSGCPDITDPFGMLVSTEERSPPASRPFPQSQVGPWRLAFSQAQYVVLAGFGTDTVPFNPPLLRSFQQMFRPTFVSPHTVIFDRR